MFIQPTVGRVVWFYPLGYPRDGQPLAALIAHVHSDDVINVAGFAQDGSHMGGHTLVKLVPEGEPLPEDRHCATWMPYQAKQAEKAAAEDVAKVEAPKTF